ncbi:MAG: caspase family protein [Bacteroidia bacterium]
MTSLLCLLWAQMYPYKTLEGHRIAVYSAIFSPSSTYLATAGADKKILIWRVPLGEVVTTLQGHTASVNALAWVGDSLLYSASSDGTVRLWEVPAGRLLRTYKIQRPMRGAQRYFPIESMAALREKVYAIDRWGNVYSWDLEGWQQKWQDTTLGTGGAIALSPSGKTLFVGGSRGEIRILDSNLQPKGRLQGHRYFIRSLKVQDPYLASSDIQGQVRLWQLPEGLNFATLKADTQGVRGLAFTPDNRYLVCAGKGGEISIWSLTTKTLEKRFNLPASWWSVDISPNGQYMVTAGEPNALYLWRIDQLEIAPKNLVDQNPALYTPPVDISEVPSCSPPKPHRYALIIGNQDYKSYQPTFTAAMNVPYARNDALRIRNYLENVLGVPEQHILILLDATSAQMRREIEKMRLLLQASTGPTELFFYYAGHGVPHPTTSESYLLPVDVPPQDLASGGIRLTDVIETFSSSPKNQAYFLIDACFSGGAREESPLAARGIRVKPKPVRLQGKSLLLAASSADEVALPYHQAQQGLFTYFFLKALKETCGKKNLSELFAQIHKDVATYALLLHNKPQTVSWLVGPQWPDTFLNEMSWN